MEKYVSNRSFSAVPKEDAMVNALENPVETAEGDLRTMTAVPLPWFAWGGGSSWSPSSTVAAGLRKVPFVLFLRQSTTYLFF